MNILDDVFDEDIVVIELISQTQGKIYGLAYNMGYDIPDFSEKYLNSNFVKYEMDALYSKYQTELADACMENILCEFEDRGIRLKKRAKDIYYSPYEIGYLFRRFYYAAKTTSRELYDKIPIEKLGAYSIELENQTYDEKVEILKDRFHL